MSEKSKIIGLQQEQLQANHQIHENDQKQNKGGQEINQDLVNIVNKEQSPQNIKSQRGEEDNLERKSVVSENSQGNVKGVKNKSQNDFQQQDKILLDQSLKSHKQNSSGHIQNQHPPYSFYPPQHQGVIKDLNQKRKDRIQAEKDAETLANRIALLKQEEIRTLKKIEETRKKALEVYYLKKKNEEKVSKKKQQEENVTKTSTLRRKSQDRSQLDEKQTLSKEQWSEIKQQKVDLIKAQSKANEEKIQLQRQSKMEQARQKKMEIEEQKKQAKQKILELQKQKYLLIKQEVELKSKQEEEQRKQKISEIKKMEDYEIELISRLKSTQAMQQNAYEELENALMLNANEFENKYLHTEEQNNYNSKSPNLLDDSKTMKYSSSQPELKN